MNGINRRLVSAVSLLALASLACNAIMGPLESRLGFPQPAPAQTSIPETEEQIPRVSAQEAKSAFDNKEAVIVDVRSALAYDDSHVRGALSIPLDEIEYFPESIQLEKDQWIITYCT